MAITLSFRPIYQLFRALTILGAVSLLFIGGIARGQDGRRRVLRTPGLVLATDAPVAATYSLRFTDDGKHLAATGADKVVRIWKFDDGQADESKLTTLRWATWREQRGTIYAMALSPDRENQFVAIGGFGLKTGTVAVIDRKTKEVVNAISQPTSTAVVTSIAFSRSGKRIAYGDESGVVWLWDHQDKERTSAVRIGAHQSTPGNRVREIWFVDEDHILSVARDGTLIRLSTDGDNAKSAPTLRFDTTSVRAALVAPSRKWIAVAGHVPGTGKGVIEVRSLDGKLVRQISLREGAYPRTLAADSTSTILAIGVDQQPETSSPHRPDRSSVLIFNLKENARVKSSVRTSYVVESMAFHPTGKYLVVAGGDDFELSVWDLDKDKIASVLRSPGRCLWQVGFSEDNRYLGFKDRRNDTPGSFNEWGEGNWRVFDLENRDWAGKPDSFRPVQILETAGGWTVKPDRKDRYVWYAVEADGTEHGLPLDRSRDLLPRCYTFLKPETGKPVRLAVGHRFGISLFELTADGAHRTRLFVGHTDDVTHVAASSDQELLVSCSRDQTISAWSFAPWDNQRELGVNFERKGRAVFVDSVAPGSPGWEAGLTRGDQLQLLAFNGKLVNGGPDAWLQRLRNPVPGRELFFRIRRDAAVKPIDMLTTVRQRPIWRFFPTRDDEWVLWRWRDYFYDASTMGDSYIGWQINGGMTDTPEFHEAEKFRQRFHKPEKIADLIAKIKEDPSRVGIPELLPPKIAIELVRGEPADKEISVKISVEPRTDAFVAEPKEVGLWINDYKYQRWTKVGETFSQTVSIARNNFRSGANRIIAQAYNQAGVRGDSGTILVTLPDRSAKSQVFGLCVGISDYSRAAKSASGRRLWDNLFFAAEDARSVAERWRQQADTDLFEAANIRLLSDDEATKLAIIHQLRDLRDKVKADDLFVLFLAGHGYAKRIRKNVFQPASFAYACPTFDIANPKATGIAGDELYEEIVALPCRKLLLFDCCHSGSTNILRELAPEGIGPIMLAACSAHQSSYDIPFLGHGAFSNSILEATASKFADADKDKNDLLDIIELFDYISRRVPRTIELARPILGDDAVQTPQKFFPEHNESLDVAEGVKN